MERTFALPRTHVPTIYISGIAAVGASIIFWSAAHFPGALQEPLTVVLLALLAGGAQRMPVFLFRNSAVSVAFAATIAAYVLYGPPVAIFVNLAAAAGNAVTPKR